VSTFIFLAAAGPPTELALLFCPFWGAGVVAFLGVDFRVATTFLGVALGATLLALGDGDLLMGVALGVALDVVLGEALVGVLLAGLALGVALGAALGVALGEALVGVLLSGLTLGVALGVALRVALGEALVGVLLAGLALGVALGEALVGVLLAGLALGVALGVTLGVALGIALGEALVGVLFAGLAVGEGDLLADALGVALGDALRVRVFLALTGVVDFCGEVFLAALLGVAFLALFGVDLGVTLFVGDVFTGEPRVARLGVATTFTASLFTGVFFADLGLFLGEAFPGVAVFSGEVALGEARWPEFPLTKGESFCRLFKELFFSSSSRMVCKNIVIENTSENSV
jgi:hypothetical protein